MRYSEIRLRTPKTTTQKKICRPCWITGHQPRGAVLTLGCLPTQVSLQRQAAQNPLLSFPGCQGSMGQSRDMGFSSCRLFLNPRPLNLKPQVQMAPAASRTGSLCNWSLWGVSGEGAFLNALSPKPNRVQTLNLNPKL